MIKNRIKPVFFVCLIVLLSNLFVGNTSFSQGVTADYVIGPNDVLSVFVWREKELTMDVTVMSDGKISYPLIGDIAASGKTVPQLRGDIISKLKTFIDTPEVTVIVKESHRTIYVIGNVNRQSPFPLRANMTVLQALATAGGFSEWADQKNILIIRRGKGKEVRYQFNYKDFIAGKNEEQNIILKPNDTIVIP